MNNIESGKKFSADSGIMPVSSDSSFSAPELSDSSSALASPSSAFSIVSLSGVQHSYINALLLCQWDNILGPRLEHVWYIQGRPEPHTNILRFVTSQALSGEICRDVNSSQVDFKFFDIPDKGIIIPAFIFSAQSITGLTLHSLALIIPNSELSLYLHQAELIHSCFMRIVVKLRVLCAKKDFSTTGLADLSSWFGSCMGMLSSLQEVGLPLCIQLNYTAFSPDQTIEVDFLRHAITSHLTTFSRSVVIGKSADTVNIMIYTLGLFCWDNELMCSRRVLSECQWPYCQELFIQGCIKSQGPNDSLHLSPRDLLCSRYPTTIIDVEMRDVTQSSSPIEHQRLSHCVLIEELEELYKGNSGFTTEALLSFQSFNLQESLVKDLIDDIHRLPPERGIREAYIKHFMYTLQRRAHSLIKYVEAESVTNGQSTSRLSAKRLRQDLCLQLEGDFRIVLATAEKLKPGLFYLLLGGKKNDNEYLPTMADVL